MTYTVQELALQYAESLVRFHEVNQHVEGARKNFGQALREDEMELRRARDEMYDAQNALNTACERQAELNFLA